MRLTVITCTYQREQAMTLCHQWMARQTRRPDQWLILDGPEPMLEKFWKALVDGSITGDAVVCVEDDDWYAQTYLEWCEKKLQRYELIGEGLAIYYNVRARWWSECGNKSHASLCQTAFRRSLFSRLANIIRTHNCPWFDTQLWKLQCNKLLSLPKDGERLVIGMKALPGTKGYSREHWREDPDGCQKDLSMEKLYELIGQDALEYGDFYEPPPELPAWTYKVFPKIEAHILAFNEAEIIGYTLRHYRQFCTRIVVHDGGSTDGTKEIARMYGAEVVHWQTDGLNDGAAAELKNTCWKGTDADWVICVDTDELVYFPEGAHETLEQYRQQRLPIVKPQGFEMFSEEYPTGDGQIYDEVKMGAPDDKWYGKPVLFTPHLVKESGFGMGAHECDTILVNDVPLLIRSKTPNPTPPCYMLHFHQIGPAERIAERYDAIRKRYSEFNETRKLGNRTPGAEHVQQKRDLILPNLRQVIP